MSLFSVIIPLYNKANYIGRAITSVLTQSVQDYEIIIVDDGSTDGGAEIVKGFSDPRIRLLQQKNMGVSEARNVGIRNSAAKLISFLDADDTWKSGYLSTITALSEKYPQAGAYATAYEIVLPTGTIIIPKHEDIPPSPWEGLIPNYFRAALGPPPLCTSATTIPKWVFQNVGYFPVGVPLGEDIDMWGRIALKYDIAFSTHIGATYYRDEPGRLKREHYYVKNPIAPFVKTARAAIAQGDIGAVNENDLCEYLERLQIAAACECLLDGNNPAAARKILLETRPRTCRFKFKKYRALIQTYLPINFVRSALRIKAILSGRY